MTFDRCPTFHEPANDTNDGSSARGVIVPRVIGRAGSSAHGPTLVCVCGIHGNEPSGVHALQRVLATLHAEGVEMHGHLVALSGNRAALACGRRFMNTDLNRTWMADQVARVRASTHDLEAEDRELLELDRALGEVIANSPGPCLFLDLHSTSSGGAPFTSLDDTLANRKLALPIPVAHVLGLEEELAGTLLAVLGARGHPAIGFEAGQHESPASVDHAAAAVWIVLEESGILPRGSRPEVLDAHRTLATVSRHLPHVVEVRYRHAITAQDTFVMAPGYRNFQPVRAGEPLASAGTNTVRAPWDSLVLMPLYQQQGDDGFFLVRSVHPFWLALSAAMRKLHAERIVHWLPGVRRSSGEPDTLIVDRHWARWLALQIFHLLGFKRRSISTQTLEMTKRREPAWTTNAPATWE